MAFSPGLGPRKAYDEKQFLELLQEYKSDETKKARRNVSAIAFVVVVAAILQVRLTDVRVMGVDMSASAELPVLLITSGLIAYWTLMFVLTWRHDREIQAERALALNAEVKRLVQRKEDVEKRVKETPHRTTADYPDYNEVTAALEAYERQRARTARAAQYGATIKFLEYYVPLALSGGASVVLAYGVARVTG
jgi:hypothetical protein